jgi:hypothetical protein
MPQKQNPTTQPTPSERPATRMGKIQHRTLENTSLDATATTKKPENIRFNIAQTLSDK